jgi:hypothetical protein
MITIRREITHYSWTKMAAAGSCNIPVNIPVYRFMEDNE